MFGPHFNSETIESVAVALLNEPHARQTIIVLVKAGDVAGHAIEHQRLPNFLEDLAIGNPAKFNSEVPLVPLVFALRRDWVEEEHHDCYLIFLVVVILEHLELVFHGVVQHIAHLGVWDRVPRLMECYHVVEPRHFLAKFRVVFFHPLLHLLVGLVKFDLLPDRPLVVLHFLQKKGSKFALQLFSTASCELQQNTKTRCHLPYRD